MIWFVLDMSVKKTYSCRFEGCGLPFDAYPPDDFHTIATLDKKKDSIKRTYRCPKKHLNTIYWSKKIKTSSESMKKRF
jgi:hypothetical protein